MNDISMVAQTLVKSGFKGAMVSVQDGDELKMAGCGKLKIGQLALIVLAAYLEEIPKERREEMARYIAARAMENIEDVD